MPHLDLTRSALALASFALLLAAPACADDMKTPGETDETSETGGDESDGGSDGAGDG